MRIYVPLIGIRPDPDNNFVSLKCHFRRLFGIYGVCCIGCVYCEYGAKYTLEERITAESII
jgi:hypothetical protein